MKARVTFSVVVAIVLSVAGVVLTERRGDPAQVISEVEEQLAAAFQPKPLSTPQSLEGKFSNIVQIAPAWSEVQGIASQLTWQNRQIAEAKGLARYDARPSDVYSYDWDKRDATAALAWEVEESYEFSLRRAKSVAAAGAIGFAGSLGILSACAWLWSAFLRRVRELSNAMRGRA